MTARLRQALGIGIAAASVFFLARAWAYAADPTLDQIAGNSGWAGAGLLGAVLAWLLLWHLPAKDKQLAEKDAAHNAHVERLTALHATEMEKALATFAMEAREQRAECRAELERFSAAVQNGWISRKGG